MKKSQLRKLIRKVINEQVVVPVGQTTSCEPGPNCVAPTINENSLGTVRVECPSGFMLEGGTNVQGVYFSGNPNPVGLLISRCVLDPVSVCYDFNQLTGGQQQLMCQAYNNMTPGSNPSLETIGENCCNNVVPSVPSQGEGTGSMSGTGSMAGMPQKPQIRRR
jgi:hypothetical protein